jgi:hypothetical protein
MARRFRDRSRLDRTLERMQRRGVRRGVYGSSRMWFWIAVFAWGSRRLRRAVGSESVLVYRGELRPGETVQIGHLPETYQGKRVRSRRRRIVSS